MGRIKLGRSYFRPDSIVSLPLPHLIKAYVKISVGAARGAARLSAQMGLRMTVLTRGVWKSATAGRIRRRQIRPPKAFRMHREDGSGGTRCVFWFGRFRVQMKLRLMNGAGIPDSFTNYRTALYVLQLTVSRHNSLGLLFQAF